MERKSLESAAQAYSYLRGYLTIPVGLGFMVAGLANEDVGPFRQIWAFWVAIGILVVAFIFIDHYYKQNYGTLIRSKKIQGREMLLSILILPVLFGGQQVDWSLDLPISQL